MKALMGGFWLVGLLAAALGLYLYSIILALSGVLAGAASWYDELLQEKQAASWRKNYPNYKY